MLEEGTASRVQVRGRRVLLRDLQTWDVEARLRWVTVETAWREWDARWERDERVPTEEVEALRQRLLQQISEPPSAPRRQLSIERIGRPVLGWVGQYHYDEAHHRTWVGINICACAF